MADCPPAEQSSTWVVIFVRVWAGWMALCHVAALVGTIAALFVQHRDAITLFALVNHIVALVAAGMLLIPLRSTIFVLLIAFALNTVYFFAISGISLVAALVGFGFGVFLYGPPAVLIYSRGAEFS
jgi:hypothetical protein